MGNRICDGAADMYLHHQKGVLRKSLTVSYSPNIVPWSVHIQRAKSVSMHWALTHDAETVNRGHEALAQGFFKPPICPSSRAESNFARSTKRKAASHRNKERTSIG